MVLYSGEIMPKYSPPRIACFENLFFKWLRLRKLLSEKDSQRIDFGPREFLHELFQVNQSNYFKKETPFFNST